MPQKHLMLNIMPASDRTFHTRLNEYQKNLAMINAAKKFGFLPSVLDIFSIELPFNGNPGERSDHSDAIYIHGKHVH